MLRWCHPVHAEDMLVVLGARRRWPFRCEGPNGSALLLEMLLPLPGTPVLARLSTEYSGRRACSSHGLWSGGENGGKTSQQWQGTHRAEETGRSCRQMEYTCRQIRVAYRQPDGTYRLPQFSTNNMVLETRFEQYLPTAA
ncbi:hypothetical protein Taro_006307 [Colocasia esculenta]|uniref:Uncharacterized protein n=1 Tax=Colocasia esculenta TaxID=4460 RepID=A0A843TVN1_COLES|nr:hypothetical protein [Colocasia esculenta]